ncbi:unnamed protein product, partial [Rotaria magnacalcarata]
PNYLHVVTAVETRAMKLRNAKLSNTNNTEQLKSDSLDTSLEENRITPFTNEQLKEAQQQEDCANKILNNIKKRKNYLIKSDLLMHNPKHPVPYVPQDDLRRIILHIYHDTAANGAHFGRNKTIHKIQQRYF